MRKHKRDKTETVYMLHGICGWQIGIGILIGNGFTSSTSVSTVSSHQSSTSIFHSFIIHAVETLSCNNIVNKAFKQIYGKFVGV